MACSYLSIYSSKCKEAVDNFDADKLQAAMECIPECRTNEHFSSKYDPMLEMCRSIQDNSNRIQGRSDQSVLIEGCACLPGYYRDDNGDCVLKSMCACYDNYNLILNPGEGNGSLRPDPLRQSKFEI